MPLILYALGGRIGCAASHSQIDVSWSPPGTASLWLASGRRWGSLNWSDSSSRDSQTPSGYTQARALIGAESTSVQQHQATEAESCVPVAAADTFHRASQSDHDRRASRAAASPRRSSLTKRPRARISAPLSLAVRPATWAGLFRVTAMATGYSRCAPNPERKRARARGGSWPQSRTGSANH